MIQPPALTQDTVHLALETTGRTGSVALFKGETVLRQAVLDGSTRTAASLGPEIDQTLRWCGDSGHQLAFLSVADGPGSFTGLRIGVTTAKTLSYALGLPLIGVDSLAAIAATALQSRPELGSIEVVTNAYRGQVFYGSFERETLLPAAGADSIPSGWTAYPESVRVLDKDQWQEKRQAIDGGPMAGDAAPLGDLADRLIVRECDAVGVGLLGWRAAWAGQWADAFEMVPRYLKPSAAEEKAAEKA